MNRTMTFHGALNNRKIALFSIFNRKAILYALGRKKKKIQHQASTY